VQETSQSSEALSAVASWQRARENCQREVQEIIDQCKADGKKYEAPDFNPLENENKAGAAGVPSFFWSLSNWQMDSVAYPIASIACSLRGAVCG
jgi:hypothetical protein